jgi:hypothetical protein
MQSRRSRIHDDARLARHCDLLLRGVGEINTLSGIEWLREMAYAWLPDAPAERARVEVALETRAAVISDAEAARPLLDFNWTPRPGPMDRIIDQLQQRGPRLVRDDSDRAPKPSPSDRTATGFVLKRERG